MKSKGPLVARILLGLVFFVFGLNGFLHFLEEPEAPPEGEAFLSALFESGYVMTLVKTVEVTCGALLLSGYFVPLALVLLTPVLVNIAGYHIFLDSAPQGLVTVAVILALHAFLTTQHWSTFKPLLVPKPDPGKTLGGETAE